MDGMKQKRRAEAWLSSEEDDHMRRLLECGELELVAEMMVEQIVWEDER